MHLHHMVHACSQHLFTRRLLTSLQAQLKPAKGLEWCQFEPESRKIKGYSSIPTGCRNQAETKRPGLALNEWHNNA